MDGRALAATISALLVAAVLASAGCTAGSRSSPTATPAAGQLLAITKTPQDGVIVNDLGNGRSYPVRIAPKSLERVPASQWKDVALEDDMKGKDPYYFTVSYTNIGTTEIVNDLLWFYAPGLVGGGEYTRVDVLPSNRCSTLTPDIQPKQTTTICYTFLVERGHTPTAVVFRGDPENPITWPID